MFSSRKSALRQAKRDAKIPVTQPPKQVNYVKMTNMNGQTILDHNGMPIQTREYVFVRDDKSLIVIQEHSVGHQFGNLGGVGDQGPHFNVRPIENTRTGRVFGTQEHYLF